MSPERLVLPNAGGIKKAVQAMCDKAADLAVEHVEREIGLQPRTFARGKKALFPRMDEILTEYSEKRAFWITGIIKEAILAVARKYLLDWVKERGDEITEGFEGGLWERLKDWLPYTDKAGRTINRAARTEVIARTNVMDMYNYGRKVMYDAPELRGWVVAYRYSAIMDERTTEICRALHGRIFTKEDLNGYIPPNHFNCRSTITAVTRMDKGWDKEHAKWQKRALPEIPDGFGGVEA